MVCGFVSCGWYGCFCGLCFDLHLVMVLAWMFGFVGGAFVWIRFACGVGW